MTIDEAIKILHPDTTYRALFGVEGKEAIKLVEEACIVACECMEKQISKKPYHISEIDDNDNAMVECPICHAKNDYSINTIKSGYCWKCGQKLDWSVEE